MIQGHLIQAPEIKCNWIKSQYKHIHFMSQKDQKKDYNEDHSLVSTKIEKLEPVLNNADISEVFRRFKENKDAIFYPVINQREEPVGIIREKSFKDYAYSRYGNELLKNPSFGRNIDRFITKFPMAEINMPAEKILEIYAHNENIEGILMTDKMKYAGFLSASSLLNILNEKNLASARDQNPLSKLPGNTLVYEYVSESVRNIRDNYIFVYFDFDNFKPYNDKYGFRHGDRVILLFAELLKKLVRSRNRFAGHIGGDDFFLGIHQESTDKVYPEILEVIRQFNRDVESFYDAASIKKGYIIAWGSEGKMNTVPLLTVSAVILKLPDNRPRIYSTGEIAALVEKLKHEAKKSLNKVSCINISDMKKDFNSSVIFSKEGETCGILKIHENCGVVNTPQYLRS